MKATIYIPSHTANGLRIIERTPRRMTTRHFIGCLLNQLGIVRRKPSAAAFAEDVEVQSTPTRRNAVLVIES